MKQKHINKNLHNENEIKIIKHSSGKWRREAMLAQIFNGIGVLDCLTLRQRALFASMFIQTEFQPGEILWKSGEMLSKVYIITSGCYELHKIVTINSVDDDFNSNQYDAQQFKEASNSTYRLQNQLKEFHKGRSNKMLLIDLPALYHGLTLTTDLIVSKHNNNNNNVCVGFVASASDLLSFLRATPTLLFRMHSEFVADNNGLSLFYFFKFFSSFF